MKTLIVNADDFGFTADVNDGIAHAHRNGILTATTLMANGAAFDHAVQLARELPSLDIGCHFVLVGDGHSLVPPYRKLPGSVAKLAAAVFLGRLDVEAELDAQLQRIVSAGIRPLHIDTHKHTHLLPPVLNAIVRVAHRYGVRFIRRPFDLPLGSGMPQIPFMKRQTAHGIALQRARFRRILAANGYRSTDHFAGFQITGRFEAAHLVSLLATLPDGSTELMTHPGFRREELTAAPTRLKQSREIELQALCNADVKRAMEQNNIRLSGYRQLL
ncbi:MAG: ChbG/HpnK family deacetylase [Bryobacterales bacterium]|nr:ChbG/HpnK family deacetylase [Bryobacterales bacterium]